MAQPIHQHLHQIPLPQTLQAENSLIQFVNVHRVADQMMSNRRVNDKIHKNLKSNKKKKK